MVATSEGSQRMASTTHTRAPAKPVANLAQARKEQAAARKAEAASKAAHPAGSKRPAKAAPAKAAAKPATEAEKLTYTAQSRSGKVNTRQSATPLVAALDVKIAGRKGPQFAAGVIVGMYASVEAAQKVADEINGGSAGSDWTDAVVVKATPVSTAVSA
jgi:hypothetical protein